MEHVDVFIDGFRHFWRSLLPGNWERGLVIGLVVGIFYCALIMLIERAYGISAKSYRSRGFAHDVAYYFYFRTGLQQLIVPAALFVGVQNSLSFLDFKLLTGLSFALQLIAWLLIADFVGYWIHRAKHQFRFLWAFHTTHHSQEHLTFATYSRVHPFEDVIGNLVGVLLLLLLGASPTSSFLVYILLNAVGQIQHTQIPWKLGPLYWIVVTPRFHQFHHSADPAHHDKHFGIVFSFWDRLFGTAVAATSTPPTRYGLDYVKPTSFWKTLVAPFYLLATYYAPTRHDPARR